MRIRLSLAAALLAALPALAQTGLPPGTGQPPAAQPGTGQPPQPVIPMQPPAPDPKLLAHLMQWEKAMSQTTAIEAQLKRTDKDKTFKTELSYAGTAKYQRAGTPPEVRNLAVLEMFAAGAKQGDMPSEKYVCTGVALYQFSAAQKEIRAHKLPPPRPGQVGSDGFLGFLFGMGAKDALDRYDLKLSKEDQWYVYVDVLPKTTQDKADFSRARLVLNKDNYMPRQLWFESPNGSETLWDVPSINTKPQFAPTEFDAPKPPAGWKLVEVPTNQAPPKISRP